MAEISFADQAARAAEIERQLASGARIPPEVIAGLLASEDEELALLGHHLVPGHQQQLVGRDTSSPAALEPPALEPAALEPPGLDEPATRTILVHGAFAAGNSWWQPTGAFNRYVAGITGDVYGGDDFFRWSGGGSHAERVEAAQALVRWVRQHPAQELDVIAHSHGGNICFLASQLGLRIRKLISLATPICLDYLPDLRQIGILHHVISLADIIQGPASYIGVSHRGDGRTLADSKRVINHLATVDGQGRPPSHSELHDPATWRASRLEEKLLGPGSLPRPKT